MSIPPSAEFFDSFVPVYDVMPEEWEDARQFLVEQLKKISNAVNIREIGFFLDEELLSGKQMFPGTTNPQTFRSVFRKVVNFGALPGNATKSVPHGITLQPGFAVLSLWAGATNPGAPFAFQIPFASNFPNENVSLSMDSTNVTIITSDVNYNVYTRVFVTIEYIQES